MPDLDLRSVAFPTLSDTQILQLSQCTSATLRRFSDGERMFSVGDRDSCVYVVKSGEVAIIDSSGDEPRTVVVHKAGNFTGDVALVTGERSVASGIARGDCEAYEISRDALSHVLNQCPGLSDIILQAYMARRQMLRESPDFTGLRLIGSQYSADTFRIRDFLSRNRVLYTWLDVETDPSVDRLLKQFGLTEADTPIVACGRMLMMRNPTNLQLADAVGIHKPLEQTVYDLAIVGSGPAGLAAAVYGASEGLSTIVLERDAPGGQSGSSMRIENYLGFPMGITGAELAERAYLQANKFEVNFSLPSVVKRLEMENGYPLLRLESGETVSAKSLVIATGAEYRRLEAEGCQQFENAGVYYAVTPAEAKLCKDADVIVVGGGNSAGQASVYLAPYARRVLHLIRGDSLYKSMSSYLARRIEGTGNIELKTNTTIVRMGGDGHLGWVEVKCHTTGEAHKVDTQAVFSFIGAAPHTDWLPAEVERDAKGFVLTGPSLFTSPRWPLARHPFLLETTVPGIFAAGDVRSSPVKRIAAAVGEGSMAVQFVHEHLRTA